MIHEIQQKGGCSHTRCTHLAYLLTYKDKTHKTGVDGSPTSTRIGLLSQKYSYNKSHSDQLKSSAECFFTNIFKQNEVFTESKAEVLRSDAKSHSHV